MLPHAGRERVGGEATRKAAGGQSLPPLMAVVRWLLPAVALAALILTCIPAATWRHPGVDVVQTGFDRNLVYENPKGEGSADVATITAPFGPGASLALINLLATPLNAFSVSFDVTVLPAESDSIPFRIGVCL